MKYFTKIYHGLWELSNLEKEKRAFALQYHPDRGWNEKDFKDMMTEFEFVQERLENGEVFFGSPAPEKENKKPNESPKVRSMDIGGEISLELLNLLLLPFDFQDKNAWFFFRVRSFRIFIVLVFIVSVILSNLFWPNVFWWGLNLILVFISLTGRYGMAFLCFLFWAKLFGEHIQGIFDFWIWALPISAFIRYSILWDEWETETRKEADWGGLGEKMKGMV